MLPFHRWISGFPQGPAAVLDVPGRTRRARSRAVRGGSEPSAHAESGARAGRAARTRGRDRPCRRGRLRPRPARRDRRGASAAARANSRSADTRTPARLEADAADDQPPRRACRPGRCSARTAAGRAASPDGAGRPRGRPTACPAGAASPASTRRAPQRLSRRQKSASPRLSRTNDDRGFARRERAEPRHRADGGANVGREPRRRRPVGGERRLPGSRPERRRIGGERRHGDDRRPRPRPRSRRRVCRSGRGGTPEEPSRRYRFQQDMPTYREHLAQIKSEIEQIDSPRSPRRSRRDSPPLLIDVREQDEWDEGHIPGAVHIPRGNLESRIERTAPDRSEPIVIYCAAGQPLGVRGEDARGARLRERQSRTRPATRAGSATASPPSSRARSSPSSAAATRGTC